MKRKDVTVKVTGVEWNMKDDPLDSYVPPPKFEFDANVPEEYKTELLKEVSQLDLFGTPPQPTPPKMTTQATPLEALNNHLLLDPQIEVKIVKLLAETLRRGYVNTGTAFDSAPVNDLISSLFLNVKFRDEFRNLFADMLKKVTIGTNKDYVTGDMKFYFTLSL